MKIIATILLTPLLFSSCRPTKSVAKTETKQETKRDSVIIKETVRFDTLRVPGQTAVVSIPFQLFRDSLLNTIEKTNGRASVKIFRINDTLYAEAKCDSLEKVVASMNTELKQWHDYVLNQKQTSNTVKVEVPFWFKLIQIGLCLIGLFLIIKQFFLN